MFLYDVSSTAADTLPVFARSHEDAAGFFIDWCLVHRGGAPFEFVVTRRAIDPGNPNATRLGEALAKDSMGIGRYDPSEGWTISSPFDLEAGDIAHDLEGEDLAGRNWVVINESYWPVPSGWLGPDLQAWKIAGHIHQTRIGDDNLVARGPGPLDEGFLALQYQASGLSPRPSRRS